MAPAITLTIMAGGLTITFKISKVFAILSRELRASFRELQHLRLIIAPGADLS